MLEWYEAYADYEKTAHDLELLVAEVAERVLGTTKVKRGEVEIDFAPPWRRITLREAILERAGIDIAEHPTREALAQAMGTEPDPSEGWGKLVDGLLSREVEPGLIQPTFVFDYPVELSPFAKAPPLRAGPGRALGGLRRRGRDRQLLHRAERPRRAAAALRAAGGGAARAATKRPSPSTRPSSRRSNRGCRRPAASGSASTAW